MCADSKNVNLIHPTCAILAILAIFGQKLAFLVKNMISIINSDSESQNSQSYVKMCADSKNVNLIYPTRNILAILAIFWPKTSIFGQKYDFHLKCQK